MATQEYGSPGAQPTHRPSSNAWGSGSVGCTCALDDVRREDEQPLQKNKQEAVKMR